MKGRFHASFAFMSDEVLPKKLQYAFMKYKISFVK